MCDYYTTCIPAAAEWLVERVTIMRNRCVTTPVAAIVTTIATTEHGRLESVCSAITEGPI